MLLIAETLCSFSYLRHSSGEGSFEFVSHAAPATFSRQTSFITRQRRARKSRRNGVENWNRKLSAGGNRNQTGRRKVPSDSDRILQSTSEDHQTDSFCFHFWFWTFQWSPCFGFVTARRHPFYFSFACERPLKYKLFKQEFLSLRHRRNSTPVMYVSEIAPKSFASWLAFSERLLFKESLNRKRVVSEIAAEEKK